MIWEILEETRRPAGRGRPDRKASDNVALPAGARREAAGCGPRESAWRCAILWCRIRKHTAMEFAAPVVNGLERPLAAPDELEIARSSPPTAGISTASALRMESDPPPVVPAIPKYPGLGQESAVRAAALMLKARAGDADLVVPDGQRDRYEAAFARFSQRFSRRVLH